MRSIRRNDLAPRVELLPLIDVVFLLLTFFIYSLIIMVRAEVLPLDLMPLASGSAATQGSHYAVTLDGSGQVFFNREPITLDALQVRLSEIAATEPQAVLFLAAADTPEMQVDRLPLFTRVLQMALNEGLRNITLVGPPEDRSDSPQ